MKIDDTYVFDSNDLEDFITIYHSNGWMGHNKEKIKTILMLAHISWWQSIMVVL